MEEDIITLKIKVDLHNNKMMQFKSLIENNLLLLINGEMNAVPRFEFRGQPGSFASDVGMFRRDEYTLDLKFAIIPAEPAKNNFAQENKVEEKKSKFLLEI